MTIRSPAKLGVLSHRSLPRPQSPQISPECGSNPDRACQTRAQDDVVHVAAPACGCSAYPLNISSREDRCCFLRCYRNPIKDDREGPLFRPLRPNGLGLVRRYLDRKTPWRLVKKYCEAAGIDPSRLGSRGIGIHSLRKTAINDAIRNGATMHEVREFAGHADIRTTELYFIRSAQRKHAC